MQGPILVFGMPRSGTTWLGKLFDSHPDTLYRHEPDSVERLDGDGVPPFPTEPASAEQQRYIRRYVEGLPAMRAPKVCAKLPLFRKAYLSGAGFAALRVNVALNKAGDRLGLHVPLMMATAGAGRAGVRVVWKSIESLGRLGMLLDSAPAARAIHLVRHPCGSIASESRGEDTGLFSSEVRASEDWTYYELLLETAPAQRRGLTLERLRALSAAERMAWRWLIVNEKAMEDAEGTGRCLVVRYEDICNDPAREMKRLLDHCGLPWHAQVEDFIARSTSGDSGGYYSVFKNPRQSAEKWKQALDPAVIDAIMAIALDSRPGELFGSARVGRYAS